MTNEHPEDSDDEPTSSHSHSSGTKHLTLYLIGAGTLLLIALLAFAY